LFTDSPEPLEFPGPNGSAIPAATHAAVCTRPLCANIMDRVARLADGIGATRHMVMIAAVSALITRYTQTGDFFIALPTDDRSAEAAGSIGDFGSTGLLRATVSPRDTFLELLSRTRDGVIAALSHRRGMPDGLVGESSTDCGRSGVEGLARVSVGLREPAGDTPCFDGVRCERLQFARSGGGAAAWRDCRAHR
jgi:mycobactin peptide synthetase MbtE